MVQFDKSFHPAVLYEQYLICIFMNIHEKLKKMREIHVKTRSLGEGLRFDLACTPRAFKFMPTCSAEPSECETKFTSKHFVMGYVKSMVSMATPLYGFREWG